MGQLRPSGKKLLMTAEAQLITKRARRLTPDLMRQFQLALTFAETRGPPPRLPLCSVNADALTRGPACSSQVMYSRSPHRRKTKLPGLSWLKDNVVPKEMVCLRPHCPTCLHAFLRNFGFPAILSPSTELSYNELLAGFTAACPELEPDLNILARHILIHYTRNRSPNSNGAFSAAQNLDSVT